MSMASHKAEQANLLGGKGVPSEEHKNAILIHSISKLGENMEEYWPEMIRILLVHADERQDIDSESFLPDNSYIGDLISKFGGLSP